MRCITVAAAFASVPERSSAFFGPSDGSGGGVSARHYWRTRTPCEVGGTVSASVWRPNWPRNAVANGPTNNRTRTTSNTTGTTGHNPNTGLRAPPLYGQERNPNDEGIQPSTTHRALAEHPTGPGGSTAAWAWAACSGRTAGALSGSSPLAAVDTVPRRDHPARSVPVGRSTSPVLTDNAAVTADCASCAPAGATTGLSYPIPSRCPHQVLGRVRTGQHRCVR